MNKSPNSMQERKDRLQRLQASLEYVPIEEWNILAAKFIRNEGITYRKFMEYIKTLYQSRELDDIIGSRTFKDIRTIINR